jgi:hypothetical protein
MSLRVFRDHGGHEWKVWDVSPFLRGASEERRRGPRRLSEPARVAGGAERRSGGDRRREATLFTPGLEAGWLCFDAGAEKRRLTPIPRDWQQARDEELEAMLERARRVPRRLDPLEPPPE